MEHICPYICPYLLSAVSRHDGEFFYFVWVVFSCLAEVVVGLLFFSEIIVKTSSVSSLLSPPQTFSASTKLHTSYEVMVINTFSRRVRGLF